MNLDSTKKIKGFDRLVSLIVVISRRISSHFCAVCLCLAVGACDRTPMDLPDGVSPANGKYSHLVSASADSEPRNPGKVVAVRSLGGIPPAIASITYSKNQGNAICVLQIAERGKVVTETSNMVECGLVEAPNLLDVSLSGTTKGLTIFQQLAKQTNSYSVERTANGEWVVTKVEFVYPQDNVETGEVDVVRETADLSGSGPSMRVDQFSRAIIDKKLVKSFVQ